ncbi:MAG: HAMP domain-containing sensor histidine kinase [Patescibacteria group bacterium]
MIRKKDIHEAKQKRNNDDALASIDKVKNEFIALASHQLRTPLSVVNWYTEMLLNGDAGKLTKEQKSFLAEIYSSTQSMIALVNSLLNISRLELGTLNVEPELTDIRGIISGVLTDFSSMVKKKHLKVAIRIPSTLSKFVVDGKLIKIVIQNLIKNAVKYTPDSGSIFLSVIRDKKKIILLIRDSGIGIPRNQQSRIFSKFFRADNAKEVDTDGSGLGLYIVKAIVQKVGGKVWYVSSQNHGSSFFVALPNRRMKKSVLK